MKGLRYELTSEKQDIYARVTDKIISDLEQGTRPWLKPWNAENAAGRITKPLRHNGIPYQGINVLLLWGEAMEKGYTASVWITYKQSQTLGGQVRGGEKSALVVYANTVNKTDKNDAGEDVEKSIPFMRSYSVFNVEQIDGLPAQYYARAEPPKPIEVIAQAEVFFAATGITVQHGGNRAFYSPSRDLVQLPPADSFRDAESYSATKAHEMAHATGHPLRLNREFGKRFGDNAYSAEELVAEISSAFLCADLKITPEPREDHAAYIGHWLQILKADKRAIFTAAAHAQKAAEWLTSKQPGYQPTRPEPTQGINPTVTL